MSRLLLACLLVALCGTVLGCEKFDKHIQKFCTFTGERQPCTQPNAQSYADKCCNSPNKCSSLEFPLNEVCCFTKDCLSRCYPGQGHITGTVY